MHSLNEIVEFGHGEENIDAYLQTFYPEIGNYTWKNLVATWTTKELDHQSNSTVDLNSSVVVDFRNFLHELIFPGSGSSFPKKYNSVNFIHDDTNPYNWYENDEVANARKHLCIFSMISSCAIFYLV